MPTPRPIIVPSVGATLGISIAWPPRAIAQSPMTTPRIAVVIGIAIATAVPKVNSRMTMAARIPSASLAWVEGDETVVLGAGELPGRRALDVVSMAEHLAAKHEWIEALPDADHVARICVRRLATHPERIDELLAEIAMGRSILEG